MLGVTFSAKLSVSRHVSDLLSRCSQSYFALRTLRQHGLPADALQVVFQAIVSHHDLLLLCICTCTLFCRFHVLSLSVLECNFYIVSGGQLWWAIAYSGSLPLYLTVYYCITMWVTWSINSLSLSLSQQAQLCLSSLVGFCFNRRPKPPRSIITTIN